MTTGTRADGWGWPRASAELKKLCRELVPEASTPVTVGVKPAKGAAHKDCFPNVDGVVARDGGHRELGWKLVENLPGVLLEAEFHAIWVDDAGRRRDVTPSELPGVSRILFLPAPGAMYEGRQVDNRRVALVDDELVREHIRLQTRLFRFLNHGRRSEEHGEIRLEGYQATVAAEAFRVERQVIEKYLPAPCD